MTNKTLCACGCNQFLIERPHHKYRDSPVLFLPGHNSRFIDHTITPPTSWVPPSGICECGCGGPTKLSKVTSHRDGTYRGYPCRFIHGHHARLFTPQQTSNWKGGILRERRRNKKTGVIHEGYVLIHKPEHQLASKSGYVLEHRFVMCEHLGRIIGRHEHVHHKNGDRADNRIANLELLLINEHPIGQRAEDLVAWARAILSKYGHLYP